MAFFIVGPAVLPGLVIAQGTQYDTFPQPNVSSGFVEPGGNTGFIPCSGTSCSPCHLIVLFNTVLKWFLTISFLIFAIVALVAGIKLVTQGNPGALADAKKSFLNAFIGLIIILSAFLIVDTLMRYLVRDGGDIEGYGPWQKVACATQSEATTEKDFFKDGDAPYEPRTTASGDNLTQFTTVNVANRIAAIRATPEVTAMSNAALDAAGITNPLQRNAFRALISQESTNCQNKVGPQTDYGRAYGCTQLLVPTARAMDKRASNRFAGKSDAEVAQILQNDNAYNIRLGALYYKEGLQRYGGNLSYALARYNGGDKALNDSRDCQRLKAYECTINGAGYEQTRNYVANITAVAKGL